MSSVLMGAPLIKKVYIPKYIFPLEKCLFSLVNFAFSLIAVIAVMCLQGVFDGFIHFDCRLPSFLQIYTLYTTAFPRFCQVVLCPFRTFWKSP
jgi:ABC-type polysaccharide/polyol phosphate export permease